MKLKQLICRHDYHIYFIAGVGSMGMPTSHEVDTTIIKCGCRKCGKVITTVEYNRYTNKIVKI